MTRKENDEDIADTRCETTDPNTLQKQHKLVSSHPTPQNACKQAQQTNKRTSKQTEQKRADVATPRADRLLTIILRDAPPTSRAFLGGSPNRDSWKSFVPQADGESMTLVMIVAPVKGRRYCSVLR